MLVWPNPFNRDTWLSLVTDGLTSTIIIDVSFTDIDECLEKPCSHFCSNFDGGFFCSCPSGLEINLLRVTCIGKKFVYTFKWCSLLIKVRVWCSTHATSSIIHITLVYTCGNSTACLATKQEACCSSLLHLASLLPPPPPTHPWRKLVQHAQNTKHRALNLNFCFWVRVAAILSEIVV